MNGSEVGSTQAATSLPDADGQASLLVDGAGVVVRWSRAAEELLGRPARWGVGRPVTELFAEAPTGGLGAADTVLRHRDGHAVGCRIRVCAERDPLFGACWRMDLRPAGSETVPAVDRALLEALFTRSPIGLFVLDPQLRLTRYNAAAQGMQGTRVTEGIGLRPTEAWPDFSSEMAERVMAEVLRTGEPAIAFEKRGRPPGDPEHEHVYSASVFRLQDPDGRVIGLADTVVDVSDRHRAQERLTLVAEAGSRIGTTLDVLRTAQELTEVAVPRLADSVSVDLLEPVLAGQELPHGPGETGWALQRAACRSTRTDAAPAVYAVGEPSGYPDSAAAMRVLAERRACLVRTVDEDSAWIHDDMVRGRRMLEERIHSLMMVPLVAHESVLGLVAFYRRSARGPFEDEDLTLAQDLAGRTAVALDNGRRFVRERNAVLSLQRGMLPQDPPAPHSVRTAHHVVHSGAGGDWADVIALPGARVGLVTGSAPGRGMRTAATMGRLRTALHILAALDLAPDEVMARLDDVVHQMDAESGDPETDSPAAGATCLYLVYNPVTRRCVMTTAGRPGLAVALPDGTVTFPDLPTGSPLGRSGPAFSKFELTVPDQTRLVLYTAGLLQAFGADGGHAEVTRMLTGSRQPPQDLCLSLAETLIPVDPPQDAAVLVACTRALDPTHVATWSLPSVPAAVATARTLAAGQLSAWALEDETFATELIVSELVTNAIRYAEPPVRLRLIHDRTLTCEVSDSSSAAPHLRHARTTDEGGRGLLLVSQFAQRWGTRYEDRGKTIWAEQQLASAA
ncbi:SpoIIE family protein phosphatase [Streptomyces sp. NPDC058108]|uniref:SpoIIE family protein phosphatase n=1 Tax=Streptomyces sp. NPDC058108 TaxID=3346344 RepID=UPI0036F05DDA